jgi:hypothetical protein
VKHAGVATWLVPGGYRLGLDRAQHGPLTPRCPTHGDRGLTFVRSQDESQLECDYCSWYCLVLTKLGTAGVIERAAS